MKSPRAVVTTAITAVATSSAVLSPVMITATFLLHTSQYLRWQFSAAQSDRPSAKLLSLKRSSQLTIFVPQLAAPAGRLRPRDATFDPVLADRGLCPN